MKTKTIAGALIVTTASLLAGSPPDDAFELAADLARIALPNACMPKAAAFAERYLTDHPAEMGELFFLPLPGSRPEEVHAVVLFTHEQQFWIYDHELGVMPSHLARAHFDRQAAQPIILKLLRDRLPAAQATFAEERRKAGPYLCGDGRGQVRAAAAMLGRTLNVIVLEITETDLACTWDMVGRVWVYSPAHGSAWSTPDGRKSHRELLLEALAKLGIQRPFTLKRPDGSES